MVFIAAAILMYAICWKWGNWKEWERYYPTVLFVIVGNMTCDILLHAKPLWEFTDVVGRYTFLTVGMMVVLYPATVVLYLSLYPQKPLQQVLYILLWAGIYLLIEIVSIAIGTFTHHDGWNMHYTAIHNIIMFAVIRLHYKKPLLVWPLAFLLAFIVMWYFRIPQALPAG